MEIFLTCDANWDSGIDKVLRQFSDSNFKQFFSNSDYGEAIAEIAIVFMCRDSDLSFKQRVSYKRQDKVFYMDLMLDYNAFRLLSLSQKQKLIANTLVTDLVNKLLTYRLKEFDADRFKYDLGQWFKINDWLD